VNPIRWSLDNGKVAFPFFFFFFSFIAVETLIFEILFKGEMILLRLLIVFHNYQ
jgi:hypothetical protein